MFSAVFLKLIHVSNFFSVSFSIRWFAEPRLRFLAGDAKLRCDTPAISNIKSELSFFFGLTTCLTVSLAALADNEFKRFGVSDKLGMRVCQ